MVQSSQPFCCSLQQFGQMAVGVTAPAVIVSSDSVVYISELALGDIPPAVAQARLPVLLCQFHLFD